MTIPLDKVDATDVDALPDEIILCIFKLLSLESLLACEDVCSRWRKLARDITLWRRLMIVYSGKPGQTEVSEKNLEIITTHKENICCLKIQYVYNYSLIKSIIENCDNITSLELVMCRVEKDFENDIKKWPNLKKLSMKNSLLLHSNEDVSIDYDKFSDLQYLSLSDFALSPLNCDTLLRCTHLRHIFIEKIRNLELSYIEQLIISKIDILETFHIYGGEAVDDQCLTLLSKCQLLKDLAIIRCENLSDEGLITLTKLKNVEHLQIWNNSNFSEKILLRTLGSTSLTAMQSLSLSRIDNISPAVVDVIATNYKNLKFLALYQCPKIMSTNYETKQLQSKFRNIDVVLY